MENHNGENHNGAIHNGAIHIGKARQMACVAGAAALASCGGSGEREGQQSLASVSSTTAILAPPPADTPAPTATTALTAQSLDQAEADRLVYDRFPVEMRGIARGGADIDGEGLLARNREWGGMFSPRFQTAAGLAERFVTLALAQLREDGTFIEGGGSDTNYQAVAIILAGGLLHGGYTHTHEPDLLEGWERANSWLAARIRADGSIDSSINTRSCGGGEAFLGTAKRVSPARVFEALAYHGVVTGDEEALKAAMRLSDWVEANPGADPCQ